MTAADTSDHAMTVAVVIPTHLRAELLERAVTSVLAQTRRPDEIIVVDDAGDADTRRVVERHRAAAAPTDLRYVVNERRRGAAASRNLGVAHARSDLVALLDDDDAWAPAYLQRVMERFHEAGADLVITWRAERRGPVALSYPNPTEGLVAADVVATNPGAGGSNVCLRRAVFQAVGGFDEDLSVSEDKDLFLRLLQAGASYAVVPERLVWIGQPVSGRLTQSDERNLEGLRRYYAKHAAACRPHHHRELRRKIRRTEWRIRRDRLAPGWRRRAYTLGVVALSRPRTVPTMHRLKALLGLTGSKAGTT